MNLKPLKTTALILALSLAAITGCSSKSQSPTRNTGKETEATEPDTRQAAVTSESTESLRNLTDYISLIGLNKDDLANT